MTTRLIIVLFAIAIVALTIYQLTRLAPPPQDTTNYTISEVKSTETLPIEVKDWPCPPNGCPS